MANHYANHTNLTYEEARALMDAESSITTEEAKEIRFATEVEEVLRTRCITKIHKLNQINLKVCQKTKTKVCWRKLKVF